MKAPRYASLEGECAMIRDDSNDTYYRPGGSWGVKYKILEDSKIVAWQPFKGSILHHVHMKEFVEITFEEFIKDNGQYAKGYTKSED